MNRVRFVFVLVSASVSILAATSASAQTQPCLTGYSFPHNGLNRTYYVCTPKNLPANPAVVLFLHGTWPGSGTPWQATPQWVAEATNNHFILVLPFSTYVPRANLSYWEAFNVSFAFSA